MRKVETYEELGELLMNLFDVPKTDIAEDGDYNPILYGLRELNTEEAKLTNQIRDAAAKLHDLIGQIEDEGTIDLQDLVADIAYRSAGIIRFN